MRIKKINKTVLSTDISNQLKNIIKNGEWKPGEKIPSEGELCELFGVSRVSVRSSMDQLRGLGVIKTYQGKGSFLSEDAIKILSDSFECKITIEKEDYLDIIAFRSALEVSSIDLLKTRANEDDIKEIEKALKLMEASVQDIVAYTRADYQFHYAIVCASKNKIFIEIMNHNEKLFLNYLEFQNRRKETKNFSYSIENHKAIYKAIAGGEYQKAKELLNNSYIRNIKRLYN